jgi:hypothetical protein
MFIHCPPRPESAAARVELARLRKLADLYDLIVIAAWWKVVVHYLRDLHTK